MLLGGERWPRAQRGWLGCREGMWAGVATSVSHMFSFSPALLPFCVLEPLSPRRAVGGRGVILPAVQLCCAQRAPSLNKPTKHTLPALLPELSPAKLLGNVCAPSPNPLKATSYLPVLGQCCLRLLLLSPGSSLVCLQRANVPLELPLLCLNSPVLCALCCLWATGLDPLRLLYMK